MQRIYDSPDDRRGRPAASSGTSAGPGFDLREQVAQRPWLMLGAAVAAGFLLGEATGGSAESYPRGPQLRDLASEVAMLPHGAPRPRGSTSGARGRLGPLQGQFDDISAQAVSTIKTMIRDFLRDYDPAKPAGRADRLTEQPWPDLEAGREYAKTYHPPSETNEGAKF